MSFINYHDKEINFKLVYYGPAHSGKTTSLEFIHRKSEPKPKGKFKPNPDGERTLFFDFVPLFLSEVNGYKTRFHLYTVPGQVLYDDSRKLILKGVDGIVFVVDSLLQNMESNLKSLENLKVNLAEEGLSFEKIPLVYQYNKRDLPQVAKLEALRKLFNAEGRSDIETVATQGQGVFEAFKALAKEVIQDQGNKGSS